ncbi:MAG: hypothetical protein GY832_22230 [Chloroflexi bacterium]|nr:hypothetical protein [Chloroflexota bacterium]
MREENPPVSPDLTIRVMFGRATIEITSTQDDRFDDSMWGHTMRQVFDYDKITFQPAIEWGWHDTGDCCFVCEKEGNYRRSWVVYMPIADMLSAIQEASDEYDRRHGTIGQGPLYEQRGEGAT